MAKVVTLGEIMLRLSTPTGLKTAQSQQFAVHYGGCEANVAVSLAAFGHQVNYASKVPDNPLGMAAIQHLKSYGVDTRLVLTGGSRLGIYYVESGQGNRAPIVTYDRAASSFATIEAVEWSEESLFADVELFHLSGITAALSPKWQELVLQLVKAAKKQGCQVSFDINFRSKLWEQKTASTFLHQLLPYVDYCSAGMLDAVHLLQIPPVRSESVEGLTYYYQQMQEKFPTIQGFYATTRTVFSTQRHELTGHLWLEDRLHSSKLYTIEAIADRIGAGDAFAAGILHGLLQKDSAQEIVDFATAAAVLKHTVIGDINPFTAQEVTAFSQASAGKIQR